MDWSSFAAHLSTSWQKVYALGWIEFVKLIWFALVLDIPRYNITDFAVLLRSLLTKDASPADTTTPGVSVIIPAYNEAATIRNTLTSLLEADYPRKEIIVIDDGSEDDTYLVCREFEASGVKVFRKDARGGKASCLNLGLEASTGELIISLDADSTLDRDAIRRIVSCFSDPEVGAASGNIKVRNWRKNLLTRLQACEYLLCISVGRRFLAWTNMLMIVSGAFGCIRRSVLKDTGAWDPGIGDDYNVTLKARKNRRRVAFVQDAIALTTVPETMQDLFVQRRRWNRSFIGVGLRKHSNILNPRQFPLSNLAGFAQSFVFRIALLAAFIIYATWIVGWRTDMIGFVIILNMLLYTLSNVVSLVIAVSLSERWRDELVLVPLAPVLVLYRMYLRIAQTAAYIQEFFRLKYQEPFYPEKVWNEAPKW
jgi:cellulose synthase/poly-beta-1,6-N-acetylglucosamine synthase-like glycosyltransferase